MTRMITLDREYRVIATAYFRVSIDYLIMASSDEDAELKFQELVDQGEFNEYFNVNKPGYPDVEVNEIELVQTNQER